jgi:hypothetical protein
VDDFQKKTKEYWTYLEENYREVSNWPTWMRGGEAIAVNNCSSQPEEQSHQEGDKEVQDNKPE